MAPTSTKVRAREAARKAALKRKEEIDAEQRRKDDRETDLAADFLLSIRERDQALAAQRAAEVEMGSAVHLLITELRRPYARLAELLDQPEAELKRLRQLALEATAEAGSPRDHRD